MKYLFKETEEGFVVWLESINRYILFREPAFRIFTLWMNDTPQHILEAEIAERYKLPMNEARRFIDEICDSVMTVLAEGRLKNKPGTVVEAKELPPSYISTRYYSFHNTIISVCYGNKNIEDSIHFKFKHIGIINDGKKADHSFRLWYSDDFFHLISGTEEDPHTKSFERIEELSGALSLEFLKIMYGIDPEKWMGVFHAAAVAGNSGAVLLTASPGGGKTTLGTLMMAKGFRLLSDDFVPIAMTEPEIYQFPAAISVKKMAIPVLQEYFPGLEEHQHNQTVYLPFPGSIEYREQATTKAIVFVQYDNTVDYRLEKEANAEKMNSILEQLWVPGNPEAAERFMEWYFSLPVYTLHYSDNARAIEGMAKLLL